jgi:membrane fusion protein (multidrug efflux system)
MIAIDRYPDSTRFAACMLLAFLAVAPGCAKKNAAHGGFKMPPTPVETSTVSSAPMVDRFEVIGSIEAGEAITVVSEIDGAIVSLPFREGEPIRRGGLIAQIDDARLAADVDRAAALRAQSQATFERVKSVVDQGAGAPQDLDDAAAALKVADADLSVARTALAKTRIVAPFDGVAGARRVSPGAFVRSGQPITDLAQITEIRVNFSAPERYLGKLARGAEVSISTTAYPGSELKGKIDVIEPVLDPATRSAKIIARVANPGGRFRPGMSANVTAVLSERADALTVPNEAVFVEGNQAFVYVVKADSTVTRTALTLGSRTPEAVEVVQGLTPGMRVVRAGHQKLYEGAKVMPIQSQGAAANSAAPGAGGAR